MIKSTLCLLRLFRLPLPTLCLRAFLLSGLLLLVACGSKNEIPWYLDTNGLWSDYRAAVEDARTASPDEISTSLVAITRPSDNPRIEWNTIDAEDCLLVGSVMPPSIASRFVPGATTLATEELTWVTVPYDLGDHAVAFCTCADSLELRMRLLQLLGLPPNDGSDRIAFFYVRPQDLCRPTPDPEINDCTASLNFAPNVPEHYRTWFTANADFSYNSSTPYPWTRLGYTYDWHKESDTIQGPSEFIVHPGARMWVTKVVGVWSWYQNLRLF